VNNFNRPWSGAHGGWYNGGWRGWNRYPAAWGALAGGALAAGALTPWASGSSFEYANPYYEEPAPAADSSTIVVQPALDYSQPIAVPTQAEESNTEQAVVDDGMSYFTQARDYFKDGKYAEATTQAELALKLLPGDRTIHEFRGLCLFAQKKYKEAAAALYAVLAAGPGWDWNTMAALYPDNDTFTAQLRELEKYVADNTKDAQGRFLLGYMYSVLDERDAAAEQFGYAAKLQPKDQLSAQLADALSAKAPAESSGEE
jgi:tetratricopeptide (TPR) repeat protein